MYLLLGMLTLAAFIAGFYFGQLILRAEFDEYTFIKVNGKEAYLVKKKN